MYASLFLKLFVGLIALLIVIRLLGKKELAQLTPFDFVYTLVLGGILEESLFDEQVKVSHFLFALFLWSLFIYVIEKTAQKWNKVRALLKGKPVKLISDGHLNLPAFNKNHLDMEQLRSALRQQGVFSLRVVRDLFLEPSGQVTINKYAKFDTVTNDNLAIRVNEEEPTVLLVDEGVIKEDVLAFLGKTKEWLLTELEKNGVSSPKKIAYGEWSETEGLFLKKY